MDAGLLETVEVDVDLTLEPPCEGYAHDTNKLVHGDGPGTHYLRSLCGKGDGLRCQKFVDIITEIGFARCNACHKRERVGIDFWFIPL